MLLWGTVDRMTEDTSLLVYATLERKLPGSPWGVDHHTCVESRTAELIAEEPKDDYEDVRRTAIGAMDALYFNIGLAWSAGLSIFDLFDAESGDTERVYEGFFALNGTPRRFCAHAIHNGLLYISRLYIEPEYRNQGLASLLLEAGLPLLAGSTTVVAVIPRPDSGDDAPGPELLRRLKKLNRRHGFRTVPGALDMMWLDLSNSATLSSDPWKDKPRN